MGFIIRSAFWLSLVLLIVPFGGAGSEDGEKAVGPIEAFIAARGAIGDISGMCQRQPEVCEVGKSALYTIGVRARESARMAMAAIEDTQDAPDTELMTGSVAASK